MPVDPNDPYAFDEDDFEYRRPLAPKHRPNAELVAEREEREQRRHRFARGHQYRRSRGKPPSSFDPDYHPRLAYDFALLGLAETKMADFFGVSIDTWNAWKAENPELIHALKTGSSPADARVSRALHQKAIGYSHWATKIFYNPKTDEVVEVPYVEHYPPDTQAAMHWLANRQGDRWKMKSDLAVSGANGEQLMPPVLVIRAYEGNKADDGKERDEPGPSV